VANCVIFHNVWTLPQLLHQLASEGYEFDERTHAEISAYIRNHINRFGDYLLNLDRKQPAPVYELPLRQKKFSKAS
jgi:hypothetical protein